jgi:hypothetical protein
MKSTNKRIELNWSKLLGFNQVKSAQGAPNAKSSRAMIGAKVGGKAGVKAGPPV